MSVNKNTLLLGNGLNRTLSNSISWDNLLRSIAEKHGLSGEFQENDCNIKSKYGHGCYHVFKEESDISSPLRFECIINKILKNTEESERTIEIYDTVKGDIKSILEEFEIQNLQNNNPENSNEKNELPIHKRFVNLQVDDILTTNYDFMLEAYLDPGFNYRKPKGRNLDGGSRYNLKNFWNVGGKKVYHIHGDLDSTLRMCLGYEHYSGILQHMRDTLYTYKDTNQDEKTKEDKKLKEDDESVIKLILSGWKCNSDNEKLKKIDDAVKSANETWCAKFFTDNIDIVGFGMDRSEIDLWWLLTFRAFLKLTNKNGLSSLINNEITFHDICNNNKEDEDMKYALSHLEVNYRPYGVGEDAIDYKKEYLNIANNIQRRIESQR